MRFERNIYIGIFLLILGIVTVIRGDYSSVSFAINGPKVILNVFFIIVGILIIRNWLINRKNKS